MVHPKNGRKKQTPLLAPSILSADFARLADEVIRLEKGGADWVHIDVMDGHFVPNLTFGPLVVKAIRPHTSLPLDCHLMVSEPEKWVEAFAAAGASGITVHAESTVHLDRLLNQIREVGCKVGVSLNPASPLGMIEEVLDLVDLVLIMSVNPGFGGQKCIERTLSKVERLSRLRESLGENSGPNVGAHTKPSAKASQPFLIQVDGGMTPSNVGAFAKAGADVFVAGAAVFSSPDLGDAIQKFRVALSGD